MQGKVCMIKGITGKYFQDKRAVSSASWSYERNTWQRLWAISEELVGLHQEVVAWSGRRSGLKSEPGNGDWNGFANDNAG